MIKEHNLSWWKKKADEEFSKYIRNKYADKNGLVKCYTCKHYGTIKTMQNGHCLPRQYLSTRFSDKNCRPQCYACNMLYGGMVVIFLNKLCEEYGEEFRYELEKEKYVITQYTIKDYQEMIEKWKSVDKKEEK